MGCFSSCCNKHSDFPNIEKRFQGIEINDKSDTSSDNTLKADIDKPHRDVTPLLEGETLLAFKNLNLSSSSSIDLELNQIGNILKPQEEDTKEKETPQKENATDDDQKNRTFMGTATAQSDDEN